LKRGYPSIFSLWKAGASCRQRSLADPRRRRRFGPTSIPEMLLRRLAPCGCAIRPSGKACESWWRVFWHRAVTEDEAIRAIVENRGYACKNRGDGGQATGHGFGNGHSERIFLAGADIEISGGIKIEHIFAMSRSGLAPCGWRFLAATRRAWRSFFGKACRGRMWN
jgi:hypothetical protein